MTKKLDKEINFLYTYTMKKTTLICLSLFLTVSAFAVDKGIEQQFNKLFIKHQRYLSVFHKTNLSRLSAFDKAFFRDADFLSHANTRQFLANFQRSVSSRSLREGFASMSYTSFISINGKKSVISYSITNNGSKIYFTKQALSNGKVIKANYTYDSKKQNLEVREFRDSIRINKKKYYEI